ncbi:MAG: hypothetical protein CM1200mP29_16470 [Verrucomicrobiota bacterium]|nr:MAG: hypothetical protein CM1200mP29_16470 [Verrucomicrobiota bacterium]
MVFLAVGGVHHQSITNLTPRELPWTQNPGLYPVEAMYWSNQRRSIRSMKPMVIFNNQAFPMRQTKLTEGRWETWCQSPTARGSSTTILSSTTNTARCLCGRRQQAFAPYQLQIVDESTTGNL